MFKNEAFWARNVSTNGGFGFPSRECDVVIIGGGLCGLAVMYWLLQFDLSAVLLERNWIGSRSTSRTIGAVNVVPDGSLNSIDEVKFLERIQLASENRDSILELILSMSDAASCNLIRNGGIHLAASESQVAQLEVLHRFLAENNIPCEELSSDEIAKFVGGRNFATGLYYPREMIVDPYKLCLLLRDFCAINPKFSLVEQFFVDKIEADSEGVTVSSDDGTTIRASLVVDCAGEALLYNGQYPNEMQNLDVVRSQCLAVNIKNHQLTPVSYRSVSGHNAWTFTQNHMIYSFRNGNVVNGTTYYSFDDADIRKAYKFIMKYLPAIAHVGKQDYIWSDFYLRSGHLMPYVGFAPDSDRIILNNGYGYDFMDIFFANGKKIANMVGKRLLNGAY
jgi:glycine/D-amino acid oxidase-like deaminating enzyme